MLKNSKAVIFNKANHTYFRHSANYLELYDLTLMVWSPSIKVEKNAKNQVRDHLPVKVWFAENILNNNHNSPINNKFDYKKANRQLCSALLENTRINYLTSQRLLITFGTTELYTKWCKWNFKVLNSMNQIISGK
jgi:hypothetical protein